MAAWDGLIKLNFFEVADTTTYGDIRVAFTNAAAFGKPDAYAYAYSPTSSAANSGDIWIDDANRNADPSAGSYFYESLLHEIGHTLGLKHPFEGTPLPSEFDDRRWTVMSYTDFTDNRLVTFNQTGSSLSFTSTTVNPASPMLLDVIAIQQKYGAETVQNGGNNSYTFTQGFSYLLTIRDTGGLDTIDLSNHTRSSIISLLPSTFSSIDYYSVADQVRDAIARYPLNSPSFISATLNPTTTYTWSNNVALSPDTIIEKFLGGSGADTVTGNSFGNTIMAGGGNDAILGGDGVNYLRGDDGNDSITGGAGFDDANGNMGNDTISTGGGNDYSVGGKDNDLLFGDAGDDIVWGNLGDDTCNGGDGNDQVRGGQGNDVVNGGNGNDFVSGDRGDDTVTGGAGADLFHGSQDAGIDRVLDFSQLAGDRVQLDPGTTYTLAQLGADAIIDMGGLNNKMILVGVTLATLTPGWIFLG